MSHLIVDNSPTASSDGKYHHDNEKAFNDSVLILSNGGLGVEGPVDRGTSLHRDLKSRQVAMIAIGGAIGTGLIIGT